MKGLSGARRRRAGQGRGGVPERPSWARAGKPRVVRGRDPETKARACVVCPGRFLGP